MPGLIPAPHCVVALLLQLNVFILCAGLDEQKGRRSDENRMSPVP